MNWCIYAKRLKLIKYRVSFLYDKLFEKSLYNKDLSSIKIMQNDLFIQSREPETISDISIGAKCYNRLIRSNNSSLYRTLFRELKFKYNTYKK